MNRYRFSEFDKFKYDNLKRKLIHIETGQLIELPAKGYEILSYFLQHPDKDLSRDEIIENVWKVAVEDNFLNFGTRFKALRSDKYV